MGVITLASRAVAATEGGDTATEVADDVNMFSGYLMDVMFLGVVGEICFQLFTVEKGPAMPCATRSLRSPSASVRGLIERSRVFLCANGERLPGDEPPEDPRVGLPADVGGRAGGFW